MANSVFILPGGTSTAGASGMYTPASYGALGNGRQLTDGSIASGLAVVSSPSYTFVAADVGKLISVAGAGAAGAVLNGTISTVSANGAATVSVTAGTTVTGTGVVTFGTDDSAAIQATVTAANAAGGGLIVPGEAIYIMASSVQWLSNVSMKGNGWSKTVFFWLSLSTPANGVFYNTSGTYGLPITNITMESFEIDCSAATGVYAVGQKGIQLPHVNNGIWKDLYVHDSLATGIATDFGVNITICGCIVSGTGRGNNGSQGGGNGIGIGVVDTSSPVTSLESYNVYGNYIYNVKRCGILWENQKTGADNYSTGAKVNCWGNYVQMANTSQYGIVDAGLSNFVCVGNNITGDPSGSGVLAGIAINSGTLTNSPGVKGRISNNKVRYCNNGILLDYTTQAPAICDYVISDNNVDLCYSEGIKALTSATVKLAGLQIFGNTVTRCNSAGIWVFAAGGGDDNVGIESNLCKNNGLTTGTAKLKAGILVDGTGATGYVRVRFNTCYDDQGTQKQTYGLIVNATAVTNANISSNDFRNNLTGAINITGGATITGFITDNKGYNPIGISAVVVGASPYTYTNGTSPTTLYISAGTVTSLVKNGVNVGFVAGDVLLQPNEALVVTYAVLPTIIQDIN